MKLKTMIIKLDEDLHLSFKMKCISNKNTMIDVLRSMISHYNETDEIGIKSQLIKVDRKDCTRTCKLLTGEMVVMDLKFFDKKAMLYEGDGRFFFPTDGTFYEIDAVDRHRLLKISDYGIRLSEKLFNKSVDSI